MRKHKIWQTNDEKEFVKVFSSFSNKHNPWTVWCDFVSMFAIALSNLAEPDKTVYDERETRYLDIVKGYTKEELKAFSKLSAITTVALGSNPRQDFLGELYMGLDFGSSWHGQFFTPWNVAFMMAQMAIGPASKKCEDKNYISVCDPTCGAGCMLIAAAAAYQSESEEVSYQSDVLFVGQDLDQIVALMCYIQLSILGCAGYVAIANTLTNPLCGHELNPSLAEGGSLWFTPMWNSPLWMQRRINHLVERDNKEESEEKSDVKTA